MAVKSHKIRSKRGFQVVKNLTPMRAIRLNCAECVGWNWADVRNCEIETCCFHPFRSGKRPKNDD